jgi:hypothetical protein
MLAVTATDAAALPVSPSIAAKHAYDILDILRLGWTSAYSLDDTWLIAVDDRVEGPIRTVDAEKVVVLSQGWVKALDQATGGTFSRVFRQRPIADAIFGDDRLRAAGATYLLGTRAEIRPWIERETIVAKARYDAIQTRAGRAAGIRQQPLFWLALGTATVGFFVLIRRP